MADTVGHDSNPDWSHLDPLESGDAAGNHVDSPSDPLLQSGSFIDADMTNGKSPKNDTETNAGLPVNDVKSGTPNTPAVNTDTPVESRSRRGRKKMPASSEKPDWLPAGWIVEDRVRGSGATAGTVDKYYIDPTSAHRFRSKIEVMYFLETGTLRGKKRTSENPDVDTVSLGSGSPKQKKSKKGAKSRPLNFNFDNVPEKIKWVLTDSTEGTWTPFKSEKKVPESTKQQWVDAYTFASNRNVKGALC